MKHQTRTHLVLLTCIAGLSLPAGAAAQEAPAPAPDSARARPDSAPAQRPPRRRSDMIYRDQFQNQSLATAHDVVEALKSNWLIRRPGGAGGARSGGSDSSGTTSVGRPTSVTGNPNAAMAPPTPMPDRSFPGMDGGIQVYLDGSRMGGIEQLRNIPSGVVQWIRRYNPSEAQARFGIGHTAGAIVVSTRVEEQP